MNDKQQIDISVVIPVYQAESCIERVLHEVVLSMEESKSAYEIICVDDGSTDKSFDIINSVALTNKHITAIKLERNYGQLAATTCGVHKAAGKFIVTIDDDLQFNPADIPGIVKQLQVSEKQILFGVPIKRNSNKQLNTFSNFAVFLYNYILLPEYRHTIYFSSLRVFHKTLFNTRFSNLFYIWQLSAGAMGNVFVNHYPSIKVKSSYTFFTRLKAFLPFLVVGLKRVSLVGIILSLAAMLVFSPRVVLVYMAAALAVLVAICTLYLQLTAKVKYKIVS